ncbi:CoA transferase [Bradyrhizobium sp. ARR65]|uniref:CaiB/BaiF CoA transferase family protein n=1 Tax=Bradyrhizobium sp. ARR65 TaxID=1040989 RepID=UPI000AAFF6F1|nr:CoA transferase [Bradyrhizobium sp. ARR65]
MIDEANGSDSAGALRGLVVLEVGMVMQVPLAGQVLGDLGADVIKIERPQGDITRGLDFEATRVGGMSAYYAAMGRNKRTLALDLKNAAALEILLSLVDRADVLMHNFRPGVMERLGLGYRELSARNPRLIYAAGFGFGEAGPLADRPGQDMLAQAFSGLARGGLQKHQPPQLTNSPIVDYGAAMSLVQGILAAVIERQKSGLGQMVSTSLFDVSLAMQLCEIASESIYGVKTNWIRQAMLARTADGWVAVVMLFRDNPLGLLCQALNLPDISTRPELATREKQIENLATIQRHCEPAFAALATAEVLERLAAVDLLCSAVNEIPEAISHPQANQNGIMWQVEVPGRGRVPLAGLPVRLSRTPPGVRIQPASIGAATDEVLSSFGLSEQAIQEARSRKAFG